MLTETDTQQHVRPSHLRASSIDAVAGNHTRIDGPPMTGEPPAIRARELTKTFDAEPVVDGIDLTVDQGSVYGFLGPNGAGKTTTMRMLTR